ncbi:MAG: hypothetical protein AB1467_04530 [Candidatus Diapherotrites archaeon]
MFKSLIEPNFCMALEVDKKPKSIAEQQIWSKIGELEEKKENSPENEAGEIERQISSLKEKLLELSTPLFSARECIDFKAELEEKHKQLGSLQEKYDRLRIAFGSLGKDAEKTQEEKELKFKLYMHLLQRYSELINGFERKTIGEIKALVNADDLTIQSIALDLKPEDYEFEKHYLKAAEEAYNFVCKEINFVESGLDVNYWLLPKEILSLKIADAEDLAVFLCSLLLALGDDKASVIVVELEDNSTHAFVFTEFKKKAILLDPSQKKLFTEFYGERAELIQRYSFNGVKIARFLYKFNSSSYEQFIEQEEMQV